MKNWLAIVTLLLVGVGLHLPTLGSPRQVVFDEVHFGKFVTAYCCTHERFFDIHPPHAKLLIAGTAWLLGYRGGFDFDHIGESYGAISPIPLRFFPALAGILLPLVLYGLLRLRNVSQPLSFLGGLTVALDNAILVQTRMIALDGLLLLATFGSLAAYLLAEKQSGAKAWVLYVLAGVLAGLAMGTKFTGLTALALLGILVLGKILSALSSAKLFPSLSPPPATGGAAHAYSAKSSAAARAFRAALLSSLLILISAFVIYMAGWWLHFALLTQPGSGDVWGLPTGNFLQDTIKLHQTMLSANYNLSATHPDESSWWSWPLMLTSVFYWSGSGGEVIYFLGNPVVWWGGTGLFLLAFFISKKEAWRKHGVFFLGFLVAFLPLTRVPRALFLYHYLTALIFAIAFGVAWLDSVFPDEKKRWKFVWKAGAVMALVLLAFAPLSFGWHVPAGWISALYWLPGWR